MLLGNVLCMSGEEASPGKGEKGGVWEGKHEAGGDGTGGSDQDAEKEGKEEEKQEERTRRGHPGAGWRRTVAATSAPRRAGPPHAESQSVMRRRSLRVRTYLRPAVQLA